MNLRDLTSLSLITTDKHFETKHQAIKFLASQLYSEGKLYSEQAYLQSVLEREKQSPTGLDGGVAIPHGKSTAVKEAAFAIATVKEHIADWESVNPDNEVKLVIMLAIPDEKAGSTHLTILSEFMKRLCEEDYKNRLLTSANSEELWKQLDNTSKDSAIEAVTGNKTILAVTACPAGMAHTYMAAEALVKAGKELGVKVLVEKQGANGIEDKHTFTQLRLAEAVIFANDVAIKEEQRYSHLPKVKTSVAAPIRNAASLINQALEAAENQPRKINNGILQAKEIFEEEHKPFKMEIKDSILTGISYIIPIIVAGGMTLAAAVLISQAFGLQDVYAEEGSWLWLLRQLGGGMLGQLMIPVLSAYMAYSIADKPGLAPGFAAGIAANLIGSGFLGGMLGGFLAGFLLKFFKQKIKTNGMLSGFVSFWVYPVAGTLIVGAVMLFLVGEPLAWLNEGLNTWLENLSGANAIILGALIGAMVSFDLGGPVNKAAYTFCIGAMASGNFIPYAAFASVKMVSAFAVTAATIIGKQHFSQQEREIGKQTWLLGLAGITEGAIPFMINDPLRVIPSLIAGSAVTGAIVASSHIGLNVPGAGIFSLALLQGKTIWTAAFIWLGAACLGACISTMLLIISRKRKLQSEQSNAIENKAC